MKECNDEPIFVDNATTQRRERWWHKQCCISVYEYAIKEKAPWLKALDKEFSEPWGTFPDINEVFPGGVITKIE